MTLEDLTTPETNEKTQLSPEEEAIKTISDNLKSFQDCPTNMGFANLWSSINALMDMLKVERDIHNVFENPNTSNEILIYNSDFDILSYANSKLLSDMYFNDKTCTWTISNTKIKDDSPEFYKKETNTLSDNTDSTHDTEEHNETEEKWVATWNDIVDKEDFMATLNFMVNSVIPDIVKREHQKRQEYRDRLHTEITDTRQWVQDTLSNQTE